MDNELMLRSQLEQVTRERDMAREQHKHAQYEVAHWVDRATKAARERDEARALVDELRGQYQYSVGLSMALEEREKAIRERDLALGRLENEIKAANQARMAEERARESLDELDAAIYECLPSDYDDDSPLDCVEHAADRLRELAKERDEARAERDSTKLTAMAASMAHDSIEKMIRFELRVGPEDSLHEAVQRARYERDEARAEVERLKAQHLERHLESWEQYMHDNDVKRAYRRGAEAMREACAKALMYDGLVISRERAANVVRALPVPEDK